MNTSEQLDPMEKQRRLNTASEQYMVGTISLEEYHGLRDLYTPDYKAIALALARLRRDS